MRLKLCQNWKSPVKDQFTHSAVHRMLTKNGQRAMMIWCILAELLHLKVPTNCWQSAIGLRFKGLYFGSYQDLAYPTWISLLQMWYSFYLIQRRLSHKGAQQKSNLSSFQSLVSRLLTLFRQCAPPPYRFLPCCAKMVCNRLMKLFDF